MIHVDRAAPPAIFTDPEMELERLKTKRFFKRSASSITQQSYTFRSLTTFPTIQETLLTIFNNKCAYCETIIMTDTEEATIDRFRPAHGALHLDGRFDSDHYWWLAFEWNNLYPACQACNLIKANRFPVEGARAPVSTTTSLRSERPLLLDPCLDHPAEHLLFTTDGLVVSDTQRGRVTIDVLGLNRSALVAERSVLYHNKTMLLSRFVSQFNAGTVTGGELNELAENVLNRQQPFLAMRWQLFVDWLRQNPRYNPPNEYGKTALGSQRTSVIESNYYGKIALESWRAGVIESSNKVVGAAPLSVPTALLKSKKAQKAIIRDFRKEEARIESYSIEDETHKEDYYRKRRLIERIELHNFKAIRDLTISIQHLEPSGTPSLLLLGENGSGKSSILQAVALTLIGAQHRQELHDSLGLDASRFVRYGTRSGFVKIYLTGVSEPLELRFRHGSPRFEGNAHNPKSVVLGYGATRLLPIERQIQPSTRHPVHATNLFNPFIPLNDADAWMRDLDAASLTEMGRSIKQLLLLERSDRIYKAHNGEIKVKAQGENVLLRDLSDGYQSVIALAIDIMSVMYLRWSKMHIAEGMVLIDEIDAHLHPRWKMQIVKRLRQTFPHVQFLVTTHDPLCLRGFRQKEVAVLRRDIRHTINALTDLPDPSALRIDQILTSEYFGLNSTVDPEIERLFDEYYDLLALRKPTQEHLKRINELKSVLDDLKLLGTTRRERLQIEAADQFLAQEAVESDPGKRVALREETRNTLADLWAKLNIENR